MTTDRDFLERLGRLAGQTTYRVPVEGVGTKFDHLPESHCLIVSLCGARGPKWQPGPELAWAKATGIEHKRQEVVTWLAGKLESGLGAIGAKHKDRIAGIAMIAYCLVVRGNESVRGIRVDPHVMKLATIGASWLGMCLDETMAAAERRALSRVVEAPETA